MAYNKRARRAALRQEAPDLVLRGGRVVNVFTGEMETADVAVVDGSIVGVGQFPRGKEEYDVSGKTVLPGLIDAHLHMESSLVTPRRFVEQVLACGTTTCIVDPHECANVQGKAGIDYLLEDTQQVPANVFFMMPSCVPCTDFEDNGCTFGAEDMRPYLSHPRVLGLGEVMDYHAVVEGKADMWDKLRLFDGRVKDGHLPAPLPGPELDAYALGGISTNHEAVDYDMALAQRRRGMHIHVRQGSAARNLDAIVSGLVAAGGNADGFSFCTDDKHIEDIQREGHINCCVRRAIELGLDPVQAVRMATINTARCYGLRHLGAIAPGYQADLVVVDDLRRMGVELVFHRGQRVTFPWPETSPAVPEQLRHSVHLAPVQPGMLRLSGRQNQRVPVIRMLPGEILTKLEWQTIPLRDGRLCPGGDLLTIAVAERHHATGKMGVGVLAGFGLTGGAIATTVSHDSHNLTVAGDREGDMLLAMEELTRCGGGYTLVSHGKVLDTLPAAHPGADERSAVLQPCAGNWSA